MLLLPLALGRPLVVPQMSLSLLWRLWVGLMGMRGMAATSMELLSRQLMTACSAVIHSLRS
jgi:hypothetical protein